MLVGERLSGCCGFPATDAVTRLSDGRRTFLVRGSRYARQSRMSKTWPFFRSRSRHERIDTYFRDRFRGQPYWHDHNPLNADFTGGICPACEWDLRQRVAHERVPQCHPAGSTPCRSTSSPMTRLTSSLDCEPLRCRISPSQGGPRASIQPERSQARRHDAHVLERRSRPVGSRSPSSSARPNAEVTRATEHQTQLPCTPTTGGVCGEPDG